MPGVQIKPRQPMPRQDPKARVQNFDEVALGYTTEQALAEAQRCLGCKRSSCVKGCPVEVDIPAFIGEIKKGDFRAAIRKIKETNSLPAICGRVCPQEDQCEQVCVLGKKGEPVAVGRLERFAADYELAHGVEVPPGPGSVGQKVAVIGSGPGGLTAAGDLARRGYEVALFEALHEAGGVLVYGIPEFRLPKRIVRAEVDYVQKLGVRLMTDMVIGKILSVDELFADGYAAIFIGTGAGLPGFMRVPGENLNGVYSANEFLTRTNLMKAYLFPDYATPLRVGKRVAVIGAGNVAMDAARCSLRLGAEEVWIVYRRSEQEMPARREEVENAGEEGVQFRLLTAPTRILGTDDGWVRAMECIRMELGEPDESGRRRPVPREGSEFIMDVDTVVVAIGQNPNPLIPRTTEGLKTGKHGVIIADEATGKTTREGIFAGGDIVTGAATVILAMGAGKRAAMAMDEYLRARRGG